MTLFSSRRSPSGPLQGPQAIDTVRLATLAALTSAAYVPIPGLEIDLGSAAPGDRIDAELVVGGSSAATANLGVRLEVSFDNGTTWNPIPGEQTVTITSAAFGNAIVQGEAVAPNVLASPTKVRAAWKTSASTFTSDPATSLTALTAQRSAS